MPDADFPSVIHNYNYNVYEEMAEKYAEELEALQKSVAVLTVTVAEQSAKLIANTEQVKALTLGTYSLAQSINSLEDNVAIDFSALQDEVNQNTTVDQSAITLINGLAAKVDELAASVASEPAVQAALNEFAESMRTSREGLAAAVDNVPHPDQGLPGQQP